MARTDERENLMKMIYQMDIQNDFSEEAYETFIELQVDMDITDYYRAAYESVRDHLSTIDEKINSFSVKWKTTRMPSVDLAILRLATAEIYYLDDIPDSVSINEAVNLAKKFSTEKSFRFINGVLGSASKDAAGAADASE